MKRLEKSVKKQLDDNQEAVDSLMDKFVSSIQAFKAKEEKDFSDANLNMQKILTDVVNRDSDDVIVDLYKNISAMDDANTNLEMLGRIEAFLFEDIKDRKVVKGLKKHDDE